MAIFATGCGEYTLEELLDIENHFIKLDAEPAEVADLASALTTDLGLGLEPLHLYDRSTQGFALILPKAVARDMQDFDEIDYVLEAPEGDYVPPEEGDSRVDVGDPIDVDPDEIPENIERIGGPYTGGGLDQVHVAVVDSGVQADHPDLNVVAEYDAVGEGGGTPAPGADPNGHGTHVAGTIGARANGQGVVGVAPGVPIHAVRVLDANGSGTWTDILAGLEYVLDHPEIRVVNLSLGGFGDPNTANDPFREALEALEAAGVVVCIAAGNSAEDTSGFVPAGYDVGIVVSAYDASNGDRGFASFSNYGNAVDIASPGVRIPSTWPDGGYSELDGTSMATPAVAGVAAAYLVGHPNANARDVRQAMKQNAEAGYSGQGGDHPENLVDGPAMWASN